MTKPQCKYCGNDHTIEDCPDLALGPDHLDIPDLFSALEPEPESEQRWHRREVVAELEQDKLRDGD